MSPWVLRKHKASLSRCLTHVRLKAVIVGKYFVLCCEHDAAAAVEYLVSFGVDVYRSETNKVTESVRISSHSSSVTAALVYYSRTSALSFDSRKRPSIHMPNLKCCSSDTQQVLVR